MFSLIGDLQYSVDNDLMIIVTLAEILIRTNDSSNNSINNNDDGHKI